MPPKEAKKKCPNFSKDEVMLIINLWSEEKYQRKFLNSMKHKLIWEEIAGALSQFGYFRSGLEITNKIQNLKGEYRRLEKLSESALLSWPYYKALNKIISKRITLTTEDNSESNELEERDYNNIESNSNSMDIDYKCVIPININQINSNDNNTQQKDLPVTQVSDEKPENTILIFTEPPEPTSSAAIDPLSPSQSQSRIKTEKSKPKFCHQRRFRRPLQNTQQILLKTLLNIGNRYIERLEERDRRIADRQDRIADSMCRFMDTCSQFINQNGANIFSNIFVSNTQKNNSDSSNK